MLPQLKFISLIIRVFTRPLIESRKQVSMQKVQNQHNSLLKVQFIRLGNLYSTLDQIIDRKYNELPNLDQYDLPNEQESLKLGLEFFLEITIYCVVLVVSVFELYHTYQEQQKRKKNVNDQIIKLQHQIDELKNILLYNEQKVEKMSEKYTEIKQQKLSLEKDQSNFLKYHIFKLNQIESNKELFDINQNQHSTVSKK